MQRIKGKDGEFAIRDDQQKALEELDRHQIDENEEPNGENSDHYLQLLMEPLSSYEETTRARLAELNVRLRDETLPEGGSRRPSRIRFSQELVRVAPLPPTPAAPADNDESRAEGGNMEKESNSAITNEDSTSIENGANSDTKSCANSCANSGAKSSAESSTEISQTPANCKQPQHQRKRQTISFNQWLEEKRRETRLEDERSRRKRDLEESNRRQEESQLRASRPTLEAWLAEKRNQSERDKLCQAVEKKEILSYREVHTPQQCHRAYRLWLRRKEAQNRREAQELRSRLRSAEQVMRRNRLSRALSSASTNLIGFNCYTDYYGYR